MARDFTLAVIILALLAITAKVQSESCDFRCWLAALEISIPPFQFNFSYLSRTYYVNVYNVTCVGVNLGPVTSEIDYVANSVSLGVYGIGMPCYAQWTTLEHTILHDTYQNGTLVAIVANSSLAASLQLTTDEYSLPCAANLTECDAEIVVSEITFTGGDIAEFLDGLLNNTITQLETVIAKFACNQTTKLVQENLTIALQELDDAIEPYLVTQPLPDISLPPEGAMELPTSAMLNLLEYLFDDLVGANGIFGLNVVFNTLTNNTGEFQVNLNSSSRSEINNVGSVVFGLKTLTIAGLNSWETFDVLEPCDTYKVWSDILLNTLEFNLTWFINITLDSEIVHDDYWLYEGGTIGFALNHNDINGTMQIAFYPGRTDSYTDTMCANMQCLLALFSGNTTALTSITTNISTAQLLLVVGAGYTETDIDSAINTLLLFITSSFEAAIPPLINGVLSGPVIETANEAISTTISSAECDYIAPYVNKLDMPNNYATYSSFIGAFIVFIIIIIVGYCVTKKYPPKEKTISEDSLLLPVLIPPTTEQSKSPCLLLHPQIPLVVRYLLPLLICLDAGIFVSSNTSGGASVYMAITTGEGRTVSFKPMFTFTLANSVHDFWVADVWFLSLLVCGFSGAWPYLKLVLMFVCWIVPTKLLTVKRRELLLMALDALGKWSLLDSFILIIMIVAFRFSISLPLHNADTALVTNPVVIDIFVDPLYGFTTILFATMFSLILSHIEVFLHRYAENPSEVANDEAGNNWESLCTHFLRSRGKTTRILAATGICLLDIASLILLIWGMAIISFSFVFGGAAAWFLDLIGEDTTRVYSVTSIAQAVPASASNPNDFTVRLVQATFVTVTMLLPLVHLIMLFILWTIPMTRRIQRYLFVTTEVLNAWASLEVFVLSVLASLLELSKLAAFIVSEPCAAIDPILAKYFDTLLNGDDTCFDVVSTLQTGFWLLLACSIIYIFTAFVVMRACHKALAERAKKAPMIN